MYSEHVGFRSPTDPDAPIWRYLDLPKFLSLIRTSQLHFTQLDRFSDAFEGAVPLGKGEQLAAAIDLIAKNRPGQFPKAQVGRSDLLREWYRRTRRNTYINCWHKNPDESGAMWRIYGDNSVALKSSFRRLRESLNAETEQTVYIGEVEYGPMNLPVFNPDAPHLGPGLYKPEMYAYEHELRAEVLLPSSDEEGEDRPPGLKIAVDLHALVHEVYVGPKKGRWYAELVRGLMNDAELDSVWLQQSSLDGRPLYLGKS